MPSNVSQGAQGHRARVRHRAHLQRSDGGLRRRDPPGARDRRRRARTSTSTRTSTRTPTTRSRTTTAPGAEILDARRRPDHALRRRPRHERHDDGHHAAPARAHAPDPLRRGRARRRAARARGPQAHGRARSCPPIYDAHGHDETHAGHHRGRLGHGRPPRARRGAARRPLVGRQRLRRGGDRQEAPRAKGRAAASWPSSAIAATATSPDEVGEDATLW